MSISNIKIKNYYNNESIEDYCAKHNIPCDEKEKWIKIKDVLPEFVAISNYGRLINLETYKIYNRNISGKDKSLVINVKTDIGIHSINLLKAMVHYKYHNIISKRYIREINLKDENPYNLLESNIEVVFAKRDKSEWKEVNKIGLDHIRINDIGEVVNINTGITIKNKRVINNSYKACVKIRSNGKQTSRYISLAHSVYKNFINPNIIRGAKIKFKDGDITNVSKENLYI